jgi:hypothetical protein
MTNPLLTEIFQQCPFGGNLSIQMSTMKKPLLDLGMMNALFDSLFFTGKA